MYSERLLIAGELVPGAERLEVVNPATGKVIQSVGRASRAQLDDAVAAGRAAQPAWHALGRDARRETLIQFADAIKARAEDIARVLTAEQGKPLAESAGEVAMSEVIVRFLADMELPVESYQNGEGFRVEGHYRPLGLVAGITPWNFPIAGGLSKGASALILGNTYIWKPAPTTPMVALLLAEIAHPIFPKGVFSVVTDNNDLGQAISEHPGIDKISFTGSTATGKKIMQGSAAFLRRITLELGGNDAAIVLDDVDVDEVAPKLFQAAFLNAGQICVAVKRIYAHQSIYERLCEALAAIARETVVGDGTEQGVNMGPMQNEAQFRKAKDYLNVAAADGTVIAGGNVRDGQGYFVEPTIVRDITNESRLVQEEQFSPILPVLSFDAVDDAIAGANSTEYGLGGSVWAKDTDRAIEIAKRLDTGTVWINQHLVTLPHVPFGGAKMSGFGTELGKEGLAEFAQLHVINMALA